MAVVVAGCSAGTSSPTSNPSPAPTVVAGGCGSTPILEGVVPAWIANVGVNDRAQYVLTSPPTAAGVLFVQPLKSGHPTNPSNKILWVVNLPRNGSALAITGHPVAAATPIVAQTQPADSGPGEIYPSIIDVPHSGCWQFDLAWAGHKASVELLYQ
jgi:hypothetical protein